MFVIVIPPVIQTTNRSQNRGYQVNYVGFSFL